MIKTFLFVVLMSAWFGATFGQPTKGLSVPSDTSFNVKSTWLKERKKFPFIEIVEPYVPEGVSADRNVVYATLEETPYGKRELLADVFYPDDKTSGPFPGVVLVHGGGWRSGSRSHLLPMAQQLASKGYVAAAIEYRLSPEARYPAAVWDVKAAIRWLKANAQKYRLDTQKVAVLGTSAGAQLASLVGASQGDNNFEDGSEKNGGGNVYAVVNIDGIVSFIHPEAAEEGKSASEWLGGDRTERPDLWKAASPLKYVDENAPPFLFINSALPRFHAGRDDMIKKLNEYGIYNEVHTIPDTPHPFWLFHPWFSPTLDHTVKFLDKVFK